MTGLIRNAAALLILISIFCPAVASSAGHHKPLPPLKISIVPVQPGITSAEIKPGDIVELKVTAISLMEVPEMRIEVHVTGGAKLVSGETSWYGASAGNEEKSLLLTVQAPENGTGEIKARVSIPPSGGARFSSQARFTLGPEDKNNTEHKSAIKKDSKGGNIIEYR